MLVVDKQKVNMKNVLLVIGLLVSVLNVNGQSFKVLWEDAEGFYADDDFNSALDKYKSLSELAPENSNIHFKIATCYFLNPEGDKVKAANFFEKASSNITDNYDPISRKEEKAPLDVYFRLGQTYHILNEFDKAVEAYDKYAELVKTSEAMSDNMKAEASQDVARHKKIVETAKNLISYPRDIQIEALDVLNSEYPEYAPVLSADEKTIIFTSRRKGSTGGENNKLLDGSYREDIYIANKVNGKWEEPRKISNKINTVNHEATIGLSVDGSQLLIYRDDEGDGNIYYSKLDGDKWTTPVKMGPTINTKSQETHAVFSADGNTIYFTSDRKGGYGGLDIYRVRKLPNGEWSLAQNLGPTINTKYDDRSPFMHPDGVSLFFSSKGHETMGGFDIFVSTFMDSDLNWTKPENIGYPINTTDDDVFYVTSTDAQRAYYASAKGKENKGGVDLYMITMKKQPAAALTIMSGIFSLGDSTAAVPEDATITVTDNKTGEVIGVYKPNSKTGKYLFILPPGKDYNVSYEAEGYLFESDNLMIPESTVYAEVEKPVELAPIKAGEKIILNNIFFEFDSDEITANSRVELAKLERLMKNNPSVKIEISGHTDSKGSDSYNKNLSEKRAKSVVRYLTNRGIESNRMVGVGYGESRPIAINTNEDGSDNEEGRAMNRRIELKITESDGKKDIVNKIEVPKNLQK